MHLAQMSKLLHACVLVPALAAFPPDWQALMSAGQMVASSDLPTAQGGGIQPGFMPVIGNGYVAREVSSEIQWWKDSWPWKDSGTIHVNGFNNGVNFTTPSHRAQIPPLSLDIVPEQGAQYTFIGSAVDYQTATFFNRTGVQSSTCSNTVIEKRMYASRVRRHVLITDLTAVQADPTQPWNGCTLTITVNTSTSTPDLSITSSPCPGGLPCILFSGSNVEAEESGLPLTPFAQVFDDLTAAAGRTVGGGGSSTAAVKLQFTAVNQTITMRSIFRVSVDDDIPAGSTPTSAALQEWQQLVYYTPQQLWEEHAQAWAQLWDEGGVELVGNATVSTLVNASLYDILSSLRSDWLWSTGPGGLGTNGYCGHSFWDMETWMYPVLIALHPDIAWSVAQYRLARLGASMQRALANGYEGAFWAWESAVTGLDTAAWRQADLNENHISADIPLAWRRFYYATGNKTFLAEAWPALNQTCTFWACRFTRTDSKGANGPGACSAKDGSGNWTVKSVICPDESSGIVDDSIYTNAAGALTLQWCVDAAADLGLSTPTLWGEIAGSPFLQLTNNLTNAGPVHLEYTGYSKGKTINQADVALLQYPLGLKFDSALAQRDLDVWSTVTDFAGMFTGDSSYSAAYLALGNRSAADLQLGLAWAHIEPHFLAFKETQDGGGTQHFITGNGGFLQNFVYGYPGMRIERLGVLSFTSQQPLLPPAGITQVKLRGLSLFGVEFDLIYDDANVCAQLHTPLPSSSARAAAPAYSLAGGLHSSSAAVQLELRQASNGQAQTLTATGPVCVPVQPVEVAVVGMP